MESRLLTILNETPPMRFGSGACGDWSFSKVVVTADEVKLTGTCARGDAEFVVRSGIAPHDLLRDGSLAEDFVAALNETIELEEAGFEDDLAAYEPPKLASNQVMALCGNCGPSASEIKSSKFDENGEQKILKVSCLKCGSKHRYKPVAA